MLKTAKIDAINKKTNVLRKKAKKNEKSDEEDWKSNIWSGLLFCRQEDIEFTQYEIEYQKERETASWKQMSFCHLAKVLI